ncbi:MAG: T9SS type A sorting domain-containing protein, partial [Bacteroidia bacterium]|nr:T9SS type A sorting domain-containing protein [Bacteroidia bacterium]
SFLLYDEVGRIMMKGEGQELIGGISMVNYSSGIYFIQLLTSNSSRSFRILVY